MRKSLRTLAVAILVGLGTLAMVNNASAQYTGSLRPARHTYMPLSYPIRYPNGVVINPNYRIAPGLTVNQAAYNLAVLGSAYNYVPPYALGYNPYINSVYGSAYLPATAYYVPQYYNPYAALYNPYGSYVSPYALYP